MEQTYPSTLEEQQVDDLLADADVLEAFIHLHGKAHTFRECFRPQDLPEACDYIEQMLDCKFDGETPPGEWKFTPDRDGIMFWPGDPYSDSVTEAASQGEAPIRRDISSSNRFPKTPRKHFRITHSTLKSSRTPLRTFRVPP